MDQIRKLIKEGLTIGQIAIRTGLEERNVKNLVMSMDYKGGYYDKWELLEFKHQIVKEKGQRLVTMIFS
jgi:DNA-binding NarL/FixJ family response regulator